MPPKRTFSREDIVDTAFRILRTKGKSSLSARALARKLDSSTMPIYSTVSSMKSIEKDLDKMISDLFAEYMSREYTGDPFIDLSWAFIHFANEERELFKIIFLENRVKPAVGNRKGKNIVIQMFRDRLLSEPDFADIPEEEMNHILEMNGIFIHGIASLIVTDRLDDPSDEHILALIRETKEFLVRRSTLSEYLQILKQGARNLASKIDIGESTGKQNE